MSRFAIRNEACPHSKALPVTKPCVNPTCGDDNSDSHKIHTKESCENIKLLLKKMQYEKYNSNICGDLKLIVLFLGFQLGCTKLRCFLYGWDIREKKIISSITLA
jgi:hypothetical protein